MYYSGGYSEQSEETDELINFEIDKDTSLSSVRNDTTNTILLNSDKNSVYLFFAAYDKSLIYDLETFNSLKQHTINERKHNESKNDADYLEPSNGSDSFWAIEIHGSRLDRIWDECF